MVANTPRLHRVLQTTPEKVYRAFLDGVPEVIPAEACYLGWQESLTLLAKLVEVEIPINGFIRGRMRVGAALG